VFYKSFTYLLTYLLVKLDKVVLCAATNPRMNKYNNRYIVYITQENLR